MDFAGQPIVIDSNGDVVIKAGDGEQIVYADIDLSMVQKCRK